MPEKATAEVRTTENYTVKVSARGHDVIVDEPEDNGGDDNGPTPRELFLGSLGSCIAITLVMYARRKEWPLQDVEVSLSHERVQAEQGAEPEERIAMAIALKGPLDEEQRERLAVIATRCPVSRIVTGNAVIDEKVTVRSA
jgi:putative redox protein